MVAAAAQLVGRWSARLTMTLSVSAAGAGRLRRDVTAQRRLARRPTDWPTVHCPAESPPGRRPPPDVPGFTRVSSATGRDSLNTATTRSTSGDLTSLSTGAVSRVEHGDAAFQ